MIVGIDYSMTCPAACVYNGAQSQFWCAHARTYETLTHLTATPITTTEMIPRAESTALALIAWIQQWPQITEAVLEDYAFSATGRVFHIGEHTGILKYLLHRNGYTIRAVPPTVVKKFATGKGNADKSRMTNAFLEDYPGAREWIPSFFPRTRAGASSAKSPLSDLADAYWISKYVN